jgi:large repetitive protein
VGSTTIAAGGATGTTTLTATINGDSTFEPNETFTVNLSAPVNATISDNQGVGTITNDDGAPTYTPAAAITRQQGSPTAVATLGSVSDLTDPASSLTVALIAGGTATGVAATGLTNTNGTVTAALAASCTAASGTLRLQVTDLNSLTGTGDVQVNVTPNTPPSAVYGPASIGVGNSLTITPTSTLNDNGSVNSAVVQSSGTYTGGISVSASGVISLNNAAPAGSHTLVIRATDNCGATSDFSVPLTVGQASTIKQITSDAQPSRFGQAVTLSVQLAGVNPTGSVEFFSGATSLGSAPLVASPSGGANLKLASLTVSTLTVGSQNLTARYAGDVNNAASVSDVLAQTVLGADTRIRITPAANPAAIGSSTISVVVQAIAPGGGVPQGSVTISAGAASCVAPLTAGAGSCALNFAATGFNALSASYAPSTINHLAATGNGGLVVVTAPSSTDLRVRIGNGVSNIGAGQLVSYLIVVDNIGTQAAVGRLEVPLSADLTGASYTCISAVQASCGTGGTGNIDQELSLAPGGVVIYRLNATAPLTPERLISQTATVTAKAPTTDTDSTNNAAADADPMGLLADGYEDAVVTE